jgi:hypothetical protein
VHGADPIRVRLPIWVESFAEQIAHPLRAAG